MAARGGKFTSGNERAANAVVSKPTAKGYRVRSKATGTTRTVTPSTPTTIVTSDNGVVIQTKGLTPKQARQAQEQISRRRERRYLGSIKRKSERRLQRAERKGEKRVKRVEASLRKSAKDFERQKPKTFRGKPTVGTPTRKALVKAQTQGTLRTNKRGYLTTPPVRRAAKELKQAKIAVRKSGPKLSGPLTPGQKTFVKVVARQTGLSPRVIAAQALAEESGGAAQQREAEGNHNWLNIGYFDSGPGGITQDPTWNNPKTAAKATAQFLKGKKYGASSGIRQIIGSKGKSDAAQIAAIAGSGWATSPTYRQSIEGTHALVSAKPGNPKAAKRLKTAKAEASKVGLKSPGKKAMGGPDRIPSVVYIGKQAEKKFGLTVGENPAFGGVEPIHTEGSYHYRTDAKGRGEAIDASGTPEQMMAFDKWVARKYGQGVTELFYDPGTSIKEGTPIGGIGGHEDHVHVAVAMPGEKFSGGLSPAAGVGGAMFVGYGGSSAEAISSAQSARQAAAHGKGSHRSPLTPIQKARRTMKKLKGLGVGTEAGTSESKAESPTLTSLAKKYGVAV